MQTGFLSPNEWVCPSCGEVISVGYTRNLPILVQEHRAAMCPFKDAPKDQLPLTSGDKKFLEALKVGYE